MSVQELKRGYEELSEADRELFAALIAADRLAHAGEFAAEITRCQQAMDAGRKWRHEDVLRLHEELGRQEL